MYPPPRKLALDVIHRVDKEKAYANVLLDQVLKKSALKELDKAFITELVYGTLRWRGKLDYIIGHYSSKPIVKMDPEILNIIRMGAYQLLYMRTPSSAAVDESVKLSKNFTNGKASGFVNAVLRAIDREKDGLAEVPGRETEPVSYMSIEYSHPRWIVGMLVELLGEKDTIKLLNENNKISPITLRANTLVNSREELAEVLLKDDGIETQPTHYSPDGLTLKDMMPPNQLGAVNRGLCVVQDEAAQMVGRLLNPQPGWNVLDTCAAPGGKTTHLGVLMQNKGTIEAIDMNVNRLPLIEDNARRLGIKIINMRQGDSSAPLKFPRNSFDAVLVDPPCSDLGIIRRHPDVKWIKTPEKIEEIVEIQDRILSTASKYVKAGGVLVYSVCTMTRQECEEIVENFLERSPSWKVERADLVFPECTPCCTKEGYLRTYPHKNGTDGFFAARLRRAGG